MNVEPHPGDYQPVRKVQPDLHTLEPELYTRLRHEAFLRRRKWHGDVRARPRTVVEAARRLREAEAELAALRAERDEMIRRLVRDGFSGAKVAALAGVTRARVSQLTKPR